MQELAPDATSSQVESVAFALPRSGGESPDTVSVKVAYYAAASLVGRVPLVPELRIGSDVGRPIMAVDPDCEASLAIAAIAEQLETTLKPKQIYRSALKVL